MISSVGGINAGGCSTDRQNCPDCTSGGGGAGGTILLESLAITVDGNKQWLADHPDQARKFVQALQHGYQIAADIPGNGAHDLIAANKDAFPDKSLVEESQRAAADQVVQEFSGSDVEVVVRHGHPARAIVSLAQEEGHDCVVIASRQPDWHHLVLGSTAAGVVRHAHCSVHVVRDAGGSVTG